MIDEEAIYNYDVFISSRNTDLDRKWANWLIKEFENWSVPKELIKKGFKKRIGRVFKDSEESSKDININIEKALIHSKYLVVICSKNSKKSERIENEIAPLLIEAAQILSSKFGYMGYDDTAE